MSLAPQVDPRDAFFSVDKHAANLGRRTGNASRLVLMVAALKFILHLAAVAIIARLVPPEEFGIAALAMPIVLIATQLSQFGLAEPIVQRPSIRHETVSALFWFNLALGVCLGGVVFLLSWPAVGFYNEPRVDGVFHAMAFSIFFAALSTMYIAILRRRMEFKLLESAQLIAFALSIACAIIAAFAGLGYWAVVIQYGAQPVFTVLILAMLCRWRPSLPMGLDYSGIAEFLAFGGNIAASNLISRITQSIPVILSGRMLDAVAAGFYYRGFTLANLIPQRITAPLAGVFLSSLSRLQHDPEAYRAMAARILTRLDLMLMPVAVGMACASDLIVPILLGPDWTEIAPVLAWMAIIPLQAPALQAGIWFLTSSGASNEVRHLALYGLVTTGAVAFFAMPYGLIAMAAAYQVSSLVFRLPYLLWVLRRRTPLDARTLLTTYGVDLAMALGLIVVLRQARSLWLDDALGDIAVLAILAGTVALAYGLRAMTDTGMRRDIFKLLRLG